MYVYVYFVRSRYVDATDLRVPCIGRRPLSRDTPRARPRSSIKQCHARHPIHMALPHPPSHPGREIGPPRRPFLVCGCPALFSAHDWWPTTVTVQHVCRRPRTRPRPSGTSPLRTWTAPVRAPPGPPPLVLSALSNSLELGAPRASFLSSLLLCMCSPSRLPPARRRTCPGCMYVRTSYSGVCTKYALLLPASSTGGLASPSVAPTPFPPIALPPSLLSSPPFSCLRIRPPLAFVRCFLLVFSLCLPVPSPKHGCDCCLLLPTTCGARLRPHHQSPSSRRLLPFPIFQSRLPGPRLHCPARTSHPRPQANRIYSDVHHLSHVAHRLCSVHTWAQLFTLLLLLPLARFATGFVDVYFPPRPPLLASACRFMTMLRGSRPAVVKSLQH